MRTLLILCFFLAILSSCNQSKNTPYVEYAAADYHPNWEDKFSFLVFDSKQVDSFFRSYTPINAQNRELNEAFRGLLNSPSVENIQPIEATYAQHTSQPNQDDSNLALRVLSAAVQENGHSYFSESVAYLFYRHCLPEQLQNKWVQTFGGDFSFNVTFFNWLRTQCKTFDNHIYGSEGQWDEQLRQVFAERILNEISAAKAKELKDCIQQAKAFDDRRLQGDKEHFLEFLDKVIAGEWRLFIYDKN